MTPHMQKDVSKKDQKLFEQIRTVVQKMPDVDLGKDREGSEILVSCHMVAHALAAMFPVSVKDGHLFEHFLWRHSWLETESGLIIDPYPWAMIGAPIMVFTKSYGSPWGNVYREAEMGAFPEFSKEPFLSQLGAVTHAMRKTAKQLRIL